MADLTAGPEKTPPQGNTADAVRTGLTRRNRKQKLLQGLGLGAIGFTFLMLFILVASLSELLPEMDTSDLATRKALSGILSNGAQFDLRDRVVADPALIGQTITMTVPVSDPYDQLNKGTIDRDTPEQNRRLNDAEIAWFDQLKAEGVISKPLNTGLVTNADSRFPELAGLKGALIGSFWALFVCFVISFPLGIGASKHQVVFGHVLPLAMPDILTGTIIGLAQALGETAPLLLIGMNAFITSAPDGSFDSATALPAQIFIWADSPERGFVSRPRRRSWCCWASWSR